MRENQFLPERVVALILLASLLEISPWQSILKSKQVSDTRRGTYEQVDYKTCNLIVHHLREESKEGNHRDHASIESLLML